MPMPDDLVFMRHAQSEANVIQKADKAGILHRKHDIVTARPDWQQRLSRLGIEQATQAREWIDRNLGGVAMFDVGFYSTFLRTRDTGGILGAPRQGWLHDDRIVERNWGLYGALTRAERQKRFAETVRMHAADPWFTKLDGGESRSDVRFRYRDFQGTLQREQSGRKVIAVTHGDFMGVARYDIERMLPEQFEEVEADPEQNITNCMLIHYTRVNPSNNGDVRNSLQWRRMTNPLDEDKSPFGGEWVELPPRPHFTAEDLLEQANQAPRLLDDDDEYCIEPEESARLRGLGAAAFRPAGLISVAKNLRKLLHK